MPYGTAAELRHAHRCYDAFAAVGGQSGEQRPRTCESGSEWVAGVARLREQSRRNERVEAGFDFRWHLIGVERRL